MRHLHLLLASLALAGCAALDRSQPYAPVRDVQYSAIGHDPFWLVAIGDNRIVLTIGAEGGRADGGLESYAFPRTLPRSEGEYRTWESGDGVSAIIIQARPGPCHGSGALRFEDHVRVRLSGRELTGCGGRQLPDRHG
jgi:uncharacterized membrane protein